MPSLKLEINDNQSSPNEPVNEEGFSLEMRVDNVDKSGSMSA